MKDKFLREFMPYAAIGLVIAAGYAFSKASATGKVETKTLMLPKYVDEKLEFYNLVDNQVVVLNMGETEETKFNNGHPILQPVVTYTFINSSDIESIIYDDDMNVTIKMLDSDITYYGKFDYLKKQYIYKQIGDDLVITSKQNVKK